jgi:hypothetical protein
MIIGTRRAEEARVFDNEAGYHQFANEEGESFGSFEVFWHEGEDLSHVDKDLAPVPAGWYWAAGFPGCMYDGEPSGPFGSSAQARLDADPNWEG